MREWFAEAIAEGVEAASSDAGADPERMADRVLALCDGFGVRALIGELSIEQRPGRGLGGSWRRNSGLTPAPAAGLGFLNRRSIIPTSSEGRLA